MKLNTLVKINYSKLRVGRGIGSGKGEGSKDRNQDRVLPLKVLKADKCHYIEDFPKEVSKQ